MKNTWSCVVSFNPGRPISFFMLFIRLYSSKAIFDMWTPPMSARFSKRVVCNTCVSNDWKFHFYWRFWSILPVQFQADSLDTKFSRMKNRFEISLLFHRSTSFSNSPLHRSLHRSYQMRGKFHARVVIQLLQSWLLKGCCDCTEGAEEHQRGRWLRSHGPRSKHHECKATTPSHLYRLDWIKKVRRDNYRWCLPLQASHIQHHTMFVRSSYVRVIVPRDDVELDQTC